MKALCMSRRIKFFKKAERLDNMVVRTALLVLHDELCRLLCVTVFLLTLIAHCLSFVLQFHVAFNFNLLYFIYFSLSYLVVLCFCLSLSILLL